ncbi:alpha/beta hydrolase [Thermodesulfobacteriota bacterium]
MNSNHNQPLSEQEHFVEGLFLKEIAPIEIPAEPYPLVMIHGSCHGWWAFEEWMRFFAHQGWRSFSISLRNHPPSYSVPMSDYLRLKVCDYTEDALTAIEYVGGRPILMGHSLGGIIAQKAASQAKVAAMVLVSSVGPGQLGKMRDPYPLDQAIMPKPEDARKDWFHEIAQEDFMAIYARLVPESPSVINDYSNGKLRIERDAIGCPVLVVGAEFDRTPVHSAKALADFYGAELLRAAGCGHDVMLEPPGRRKATNIERWLRDRLGTGAGG